MLNRRGLLRVTNGGSRALKGLPQVPDMRILRYIFRSLSKLAGATGRRQRARAKFRLQGRFLNPHVPDLRIRCVFLCIFSNLKNYSLSKIYSII